MAYVEERSAPANPRLLYSYGLYDYGLHAYGLYRGEFRPVNLQHLCGNGLYSYGPCRGELGPVKPSAPCCHRGRTRGRSEASRTPSWTRTYTGMAGMAIAYIAMAYV